MMDALMLILFGMILVICIMIGIYFTLYNKIQDYDIIPQTFQAAILRPLAAE